MDEILTWTATPTTFRVEAATQEEAIEKVREFTRSDDWLTDAQVIPESEIAKALQMYADPESYFAIFITPDRPAGVFADDVGCCLFDGEHDHRHGRAARRALGDEWGGTEPCEEMLAQIEKEKNRG